MSAERNPAAERETYALAREVLLAWCRGETITSPVYAEKAWDLAAAFVAEAQRRQPEAWVVLPPPTKEHP